MTMYINDNKKETKTFHFHFYFAEKVDDSLKQEIYSIIEDNGFLAEQRIKNETDQLLHKYKHGNKIHGHRKQ